MINNNDSFDFWNWITESLITPADILNFGTSLLAFIAAIVGLLAFRSWKKKVKFQRKFELAEQILVNIYMAKDVIAFMRFPVSSKPEGETRKVNDDETPDETKTLNRLYVIKERYFNQNKSFEILHGIKHSVKIVLGKDVQKNLLVISSMPRKIFNAVDEYADSLLNSQNYSEEEKSKIRKKYNETAFRNILNETEDSISLEVRNAVEFLEKECKKIIK